MKKILLSVLMLSAYIYAQACTNFIVGKDASADGSVFTTYNADDYGMFIGLCHFPAGKHVKGEMRQIYDWDTKEYHGEIPEAAETYNVIGNINEYQVSIGETTFGGRHEMVDSTGVLDYGSLIYIALQRSKTAREAIKVMTTLAETYGYCSEGETFSICDPNEAWVMEMMGKGPGSKGVVWVALRIPDNAICAHANQSRIRTFDQKDKKNVMFSKDCIKFAREKGWFDGKDEDFSFCETYAYPDFPGAASARLACGASLIISRMTWSAICLMLRVRLRMPSQCRCGLCRTRRLRCRTCVIVCVTIMKVRRLLLTTTRGRVYGICLTALRLLRIKLMERNTLTSDLHPRNSQVSRILRSCVRGFRDRLGVFFGLAMTTATWWHTLPFIAVIPLSLNVTIRLGRMP